METSRLKLVRLPAWLVIWLLIISSPVSATPLKNTMHEAAEHFVNYFQKTQPDKKIIFQTVINLGSKIEDDIGRLIKQTLYQELKAQGIVSVSLNSIEEARFAYILTGAYIKVGKDIITLQLSLSEENKIHGQNPRLHFFMGHHSNHLTRIRIEG